MKWTVLFDGASRNMNVKTLLKSVHYAWRGIVYVFRHEQNFRIQLLIAVLVIIGMSVFGLRRSEMLINLLLILIVLILEVLNIDLEKFARKRSRNT